MKRPRIGLALGSGAARGWSHIGIIESLIEAYVEPDIVCGTSIGSLIGAAYIAGRLGELRQWAEAATWREVVGLMDVRLSGGGLISGKLIVAFLRGLGIADPIENYAKPYAAIATDLVSGREIWLQSGPIDEAVRASIALPGIFSPARIGEKWLVDGGLSNPVPVSVCRALGAEVIIAVNLNGDVLGRRFEELDPQAAGAPPHVPNEFVSRLLNQLPAGLREQATQIAPRLLPHGSSTPEYFGVLANSIKHHAGLYHPRPSRGRTAARDAGSPLAAHRLDGIQPCQGGHCGGPPLCRTGAADVQTLCRVGALTDRCKPRRQRVNAREKLTLGRNCDWDLIRRPHHDQQIKRLQFEDRG
jgi:NTE family protein